MVKHLKLCMKCVTWMMLAAVTLLLALAFWLHSGERSLGWAKPWIVSSLNPENGPFTVAVGEVSIDWRDMSEFGKLRVSKIVVSKRDGDMFAQVPEVFVTIDPFAFLPDRHMLRKVILHGPKLFMTRNASGTVMLGLEDAASPMPMATLFSSVAGDEEESSGGQSVLPFREFTIDNAALTFSDEPTGTTLTSSPVSLHLTRLKAGYDASLAMPFTYEEAQGNVTATLRTSKKSNTHLLNIAVAHAPAKLLCVFGLCPDNVEGSGAVDGLIGLRIADDGTLLGVRANVGTRNAVLIAPDWFEKPLKLGESTINAESDAASHTITLTSMELALEDTTINAKGTAHHGEEGWTIEADGETSQLDVTKLYKYWPLFMAPDSRTWVTSKLKSGHAEKGTLHLSLKPEDFSAENVPDKAIDAKVDARDITFEYLPGFPLVEHMNGDVHFTGETVKIEGGGGSMLNGITLSKATLWCPELNNPKNPMEAHVTVSAPASEAAKLLQVPLLTFEDIAKLDPAKLTGTIEATMALKFNAFSGDKHSDPNVIHLDAVNYDIAARLKDMGQPGLFGSYDAKSINGTLKASNNSLAFDGALAVAEVGVQDVSVAQSGSGPMKVTVKSRDGQTGAGKVANDFNLTYQSAADGPTVVVRGKRLDASQPYGTGENHLLKDFPAIHLDVNLDELLLAASVPFKQVVGKLDCSAARCESAHFTANVGNAKLQAVKADITRTNGARQFSVTASNAGNFLKGLDITDRMIGGKLSINGPYDDSKTPPQLNARLMINDFTLKNSQILGRILSIGSLTGLVNVLTDSGISFEKMAANIASRGGIITVSKGRASGNAIGITTEGTVDTNTTKLNLKGVVAPAYALNSVFGKIPIIGALLGGDEGLVAFNYTVHGTYADPDVMVNPLSGLTPGFLRGIFGIFDDAEEPDPNEDKSQRPVNSGTQAPNNGRH